MVIKKEIILINEIVNPATINLFAYLVYLKNPNVSFYKSLAEKAEAFEKQIREQLNVTDEQPLQEKAPIRLDDCYCLLGAKHVAEKILQGQKNIECIFVEDSGVTSECMQQIMDIYGEDELDFLMSYYLRNLKVSYSVSAQSCPKLRKGKKSIGIEYNTIHKKITVTKRGIENLKKLNNINCDMPDMEEKCTLEFTIGIEECGNPKRQNSKNRELISMIFNGNSVDLLNYGKPYKFVNYNKRLTVFKKELKKQKISVEDIVIDSSGVLGLYGLRLPGDIDFLLLEEKQKEFNKEIMDCNNKIVAVYECSLDEMIYDPRNYLYFRDIKFTSRKKVETACFNQPRFSKKLDIVLLNSIDKENNFKTGERIIIGAIKVFYHAKRLRKMKNGG